jgi:hypothetical protein
LSVFVKKKLLLRKNFKNWQKGIRFLGKLDEKKREKGKLPYSRGG